MFLLRQAMLYIGQLYVRISYVQKIAFKDVVIKVMIIMKYFSTMSRTRMKATVITDGQ